MTTEMTDEINIDTAYEWLDNHYRNVSDVWEQFDHEDAAESLVENTLDLDLDSYDELPMLDLMCIMADAKM
jgi:hypothetical protein